MNVLTVPFCLVAANVCASEQLLPSCFPFCPCVLGLPRLGFSPIEDDALARFRDVAKSDGYGLELTKQGCLLWISVDIEAVVPGVGERVLNDLETLIPILRFNAGLVTFGGELMNLNFLRCSFSSVLLTPQE